MNNKHTRTTKNCFRFVLEICCPLQHIATYAKDAENTIFLWNEREVFRLLYDQNTIQFFPQTVLSGDNIFRKATVSRMKNNWAITNFACKLFNIY